MKTEPKLEGPPPPYGKFHIFFLTLPLPLSVSFFLQLRSALQVITSFVVNNLRKFVFRADNLSLM